MFDVGCGEGVVASLLRDVGCEVVGLDIDEESVAAMNKLGFKAHCCDLDADDPVEVLSGGMFDVIVCLDVLEHVKDSAGVLARLKDAPERTVEPQWECDHQSSQHRSWRRSSVSVVGSFQIR